MKRNHYTLLLVLIVIIVYFLRRPHTEQQPQPPNPVPQSQSQSQQANTIPAPTGQQNFDYYLLNLSWSPEFCHSHQTAPECAQHLAFVLHGLWPQNNTGPYVENCSNALGPQDPGQYSDIYLDTGLSSRISR